MCIKIKFISWIASKIIHHIKLNMNIYLGMQYIYCKKDYKKNQIDAILVKKHLKLNHILIAKTSIKYRIWLGTQDVSLDQ
jgi:hypothetical protein